jgi:hypothetical protein
MHSKNKVLLPAIIMLLLVVILGVGILIVLNQQDKSKNTSAGGLVVSPEPQIVYPAPRSAIGAQSVYPPPATIAVLPTNTAISIEVVTSPTAEQGTLTVENVPRTSLQDAKAAYDGKKAVFLDVRTSESYARSHIIGAVSIPEAQIIARMKELDPNQWIIAYCS